MKAPQKEDSVTVSVDTINEQIVIAAALVSEDIRRQYVLKESADKFADGDHALVWDAIRSVVSKGNGFDLQQLHALVSGKVDLDYLRKLVERYPVPPVNMQQHISQLRWDHARKAAAEDSVPDFLRALKDPTSSPIQVQQSADRVARSLDVKLDRQFMANPKLIARKQSEAIRQRREGIACYPYGIDAIDFFPDGRERLIPGAAPGKITLITGASGAGKSVVGGMIALQQARLGRRVLMGAWEMGLGDTLEMLTIMSYNMPFPGGKMPAKTTFSGSRHAVSTGAIGLDELKAFSERMEQIAEWVRFFDPPFHNDPGKQYTNEESLSEIHRMVADSGCEVVIYDLWERCIPDGSPGPERRALFTQQQIHKRTNTHGILLCQQKIKEIERRSDKRPGRETILGSSAWVDIADTIIGVYRPAHAKNIPDDTMETLILKQRYGRWPMAIQHTWDGDRMTLMDGRDVDFEFTASVDGMRGDVRDQFGGIDRAKR
jgi:replicative DNA helicase